MKPKQILLGIGAVIALTGVTLSYASPVYAQQSEHKLDCTVLPQDICDTVGNPKSKDLKDSGVWALLLFVLNILTAGIGVVAVGAIGWAGFLYASASDDEGKVKQAKEMIRNTVIGIVAYGLMYVALQFLIPGGVFT